MRCVYCRRTIPDIIIKKNLADELKEEHLVRLAGLLTEPELYKLVNDIELNKGVSP